jgi:hypothetical protein
VGVLVNVGVFGGVMVAVSVPDGVSVAVVVGILVGVLVGVRSCVVVGAEVGDSVAAQDTLPLSIAEIRSVVVREYDVIRMWAKPERWRCAEVPFAGVARPGESAKVAGWLTIECVRDD